MKLRRTVWSALTLALLSPSAFSQSTPAAWTEEPRPTLVEDVARLEVNLLSMGLDTQLRIDPSVTEPGTLINAEEDLGLDDSDLLPQVELTLLPGKRHLVRLSAFNSRRSAQKVIESDIVFDDQTYRANERVDSTLNLSMVGLTYGYRFVVRERAELAATLGVQIAEVEANAVVRSRVIREAENGVTPLPLAGLEGRFAFSSRWSFEARAQYLSANIDDVDGSILDVRGVLTWRQNPYLVWGLGYRAFSIEVDSKDVDSPGFVDLSFDGPMLFARASL